MVSLLQVSVPYGNRDGVKAAAEELQMEELLCGLQAAEEHRKIVLEEKRAEARRQARTARQQLDRLETIDQVDAVIELEDDNEYDKPPTKQGE